MDYNDIFIQKIKQLTKYAEYKEIDKPSERDEYTFNIDDLQINIYFLEVEIFLKNIEEHKRKETDLYKAYNELSEYLEDLYDNYDFSILLDFTKSIYTVEKEGEKYGVTAVECSRKLREEERNVAEVQEDILMIADDLIAIVVDNEYMYHQVKKMEKDPNVRSFTFKKIDGTWGVETR